MQINRSLRPLHCAVAASLLAISAVTANAADAFWIGNTGSNTTADVATLLNWTPTVGGGNDTSVLPGTADHVIFTGLNGPNTNTFGAGYTNIVDINSDVSWGHISIRSNGLPSASITRLRGTGKITLNGDGSGEVITVNLHNNVFNPIISNNVELAVLNNRFSVNAGRTLTMTGNLTESGAGVGTRLIKTNAGTLQINGRILTTGGITLSGGGLNIRALDQLAVPGAPTANYIHLNGNGVTLTLNTNGSADAVSLGGNFTFNANQGILNGRVGNNTDSNVFNVNNGIVTIPSGVLTSGGTGNVFQKAGAGVLVLQGDHTAGLTGGNLGGGLQIQEGSVRVNGNSSMGAIPLAPVIDNILITNGALVFAESFAWDANRGIRIGRGATGTGGNNLVGLGALTGVTQQINAASISFSSPDHSFAVTGAGAGGVIELTGTLANSGSAQARNRLDQGLLRVASTSQLNGGTIILEGGGLSLTASENTTTRLIVISTNNNDSGTFDTGAGVTWTHNSVIANLHSNIVSTGGLIKTGPGTLSLGAVNLYGGTTTIREGTLSLTVNEALGSQAQGTNVVLATNPSGRNAGRGADLVISQGTLELNSTVQTVNNVTLADVNEASAAGSTATITAGTLNVQSNISYAGGFALGAAGAVINANIKLEDLKLNGIEQLGNGARTITVSNGVAADDLTINGTITTSATDIRNITKAGAGTLVLNSTPGGNNWSNTTVTGGTLKLANDEQLPNNRSLTVNNAIFDLNGRTETIGNVGGTGNGLAVGGTAGNSLVALGGGVLTNLGNLSFSATGNPGTALIENGTYSLGARNQTVTVGDSTSTTEELVISATLTSDNNNRTLSKAGLGTLVLSNVSVISPNTNGGLTINTEGGIVKLGADEQIPNNRTLNIGGTTNFTTQNTYFDLNGMIETVGALSMGATNSFANSHVREALLQDVAGGGQLVLNGNITFAAGPAGDTFQSGKATISANVDLGTADRIANIANSTNTGVDMRISGNISGVGRTLTVTNTGTLQLAGANTFASLVVSNGATVLNDGTHSGSATAGPGGTLGGTGSIAGAVTVLDGGTLAPGDSPGTLSVGSLNLSPLAVVSFELGTGGPDDLIVVGVGGPLVLDGSINIDGGASFATGIYLLMTYTPGQLTDNGLDIGLLSGNAVAFAGNLSIDTLTPGQVNLIVGVPEPSTVALAGIGAALLGLHVIRRRRNS